MTRNASSLQPSSPGVASRPRSFVFTASWLVEVLFTCSSLARHHFVFHVNSLLSLLGLSAKICCNGLSCVLHYPCFKNWTRSLGKEVVAERLQIAPAWWHKASPGWGRCPLESETADKSESPETVPRPQKVCPDHIRYQWHTDPSHGANTLNASMLSVCHLNILHHLTGLGTTWKVAGYKLYARVKMSFLLLSGLRENSAIKGK